ncbi:uncharacterized protein BX663DRAFT_503564 [Cokeromyces recurvatus]|uniref:uncharacterized protein n=1 Tax=Cokeromyces recurvatus TaxID=90255 RepID=UPI00221F26E3|nr:uncharacterized protein BX663DRAFT_503564 [Cokeromyces recurvatus]KAI7904797.1 hypothetical protein BX663DRAFT_503564 [Cokeromyces recurvatus]
MSNESINNSSNTDTLTLILDDNELTSLPSQQQQQQQEEEETKTNLNPFLSQTSELEYLEVISEPSFTQSLLKNNHDRASPLASTSKKVTTKIDKNIPVIDLSDDENNEEFNIPDADIDDLDPDLAAIMSNNSTLSSSSPAVDESQPQKIYLKIQYEVPNLDTLSELAKSEVLKRLKPVKMLILDNLQFGKVLDSFCKHRNLIKTDMVLVYNGERVYPSATPAGIGMSVTKTNSMFVYPMSSYAYLLEKRQQEKEEKMKQLAIQKEDDIFDLAKFESFNENKANDDNNENKLVLTLRGNDNDVRSFRARPTTRLQTIILDYKQLKGITADIKLSFEGEILDPNLTIEETELEDEDLIEVIT